MRAKMAVVLGVALGLAGPAVADEATLMEEVTVTATKPLTRGQALPDVQQTQIYAGKKTTVAALAPLPTNQANNYRQAFAQLPGVLSAEQTVPSHVNFNYRGVGDPHETGSLLLLKDGIPIVSDWFGYPTAYYAPPLESIERVEFIRGGGSLLYGPQPGPVINYVTYEPPEGRPLTASVAQTVGSMGLYASYTTFGGTEGPFGYSASHAHRQANGPRQNSDYRQNSGSVHGVWRAGPGTRWLFDTDAYQSQSGEAGRLTQAQYEANRDLTTTRHDRIWIKRYVPRLTYERELSEATLLTVTSWGGYQDRFSRRQTGATATNLDRQEFTFFGVDSRARHHWDGWGGGHAVTGGVVLYMADSPRVRERGAAREDTSGVRRFELDRSTRYAALFLESLFRFGRLGIVPAFRLELIDVDVKETMNVEVTRPLVDGGYSSAVPLLALGATWDLGRRSECYANVSQGYKPQSYDDLANPTSNTQRPSSNLEESRTVTYEAGVRGTPASWLRCDTSFFLVDYDNYIENRELGGGNVERSNSGRAVYRGWEAGGSVDLLGVELFASLSLLDAEFVSGRNDGRTPAYAPDYVVKGGLVYRYRDRVKASLTGEFFSDHFWQDSNAAGGVGTDTVDSYKVWDLEVEAMLWKNALAVFGGVNNLFNEQYYARVRSDGIEPAQRRNYYAGAKVKF